MFGTTFLATLAILCVTALSLNAPLFLTPLIEAGNITLARDLSLVLALPNSSPDIPDRPSYSGFITVNETLNSNLFFWFFPATAKDTEASQTPIVLWLDGGPGVSNFVTIFTQNGPFAVQTSANETLILEHRSENWTVNRSIIYLETPVDVGKSSSNLILKRYLLSSFLFAGFSFTTSPAGLPQTSEEAAESSIEFLRQFYLLFPEHSSDPLFLIGQSYGGHFAPPIGTAIHKRNEQNHQPRINFQGMMLLAPWTNPYVQVDSYADFLYQTGLINEKVRSEMASKQELIKELIAERQYIEAKDVSILNYVTFAGFML